MGANAKMNEFCAIMGLCNLKPLNKSLESRKACYDYYKKHLEDVKGIYFFQKMNGQIQILLISLFLSTRKYMEKHEMKYMIC